MTTRIRLADEIAGVSMERIRWLLRNHGLWKFSEDSIADALRIPPQQAQELIKNLESQGFLAEVPTTGRVHPEIGNCWKITRKGQSLSNATAAPPISRKTAQRNLEEFLQRVDKLNADPTFVFSVQRAVLYGSFLSSEKEFLGDIDVAVILQPRYADPKVQEQKEQEYIMAAIKKGRRFSNVVEELYFPQRAVWIFLKGGRRALGLTTYKPAIVESGPWKQIYPPQTEPAAAQNKSLEKAKRQREKRKE